MNRARPTSIERPKAEYVIQRYYDFPAADIRNGGSFSGLMLAGAIAF